jgi:hypothetical protein
MAKSHDEHSVHDGLPFMGRATLSNLVKVSHRAIVERLNAAVAHNLQLRGAMAISSSHRDWRQSRREGRQDRHDPNLSNAPARGA